jgi:hypothetical protein
VLGRLGLQILELRTLTVNYEKWRAEVEILTPGADFPAEHILILAHKSAIQLNRLIRHLSNDFDLFVHLDKKSRLRIEDIEAGVNIRVFRQYPVYHGSPNMNKACLELLKAAFSKGYDRYLLISGQDVPSKQIKDPCFTNNPNNTSNVNDYRKSWDNGGLAG